MAPLILFFILFICGHLNSYFFRSSKLLPWLLSLVSIPSSPIPVEKRRKEVDALFADLEMVFSTFDIDGDDFITVSELEESLRRLGLSAAKEEVVRMVERVDANGDGMIDLHDNGMIDLQDFRKLYESISRGGKEEVELRDVFDGNGYGVITMEELGLVLKSMGMKQGCRAEDCR